MNGYLIRKFEINFYNFISNGMADKFPQTNHEGLSIFLSEWNDRELDQYLLSDLNKVLNGTLEGAESGIGPVSIFIYKDIVDFYYHSESLPSMPTNEFKEIVEGWKTFLLTPPNKGSKI